MKLKTNDCVGFAGVKFFGETFILCVNRFHQNWRHSNNTNATQIVDILKHEFCREMFSVQRTFYHVSREIARLVQCASPRRHNNTHLFSEMSQYTWSDETYSVPRNYARLEQVVRRRVRTTNFRLPQFPCYHHSQPQPFSWRFYSQRNSG